ncbi:membrane dipeptidase [Paraburkholderia dipogonis]|nr:membrane dipeptidase [Paraburkholderia dipogonis]
MRWVQCRSRCWWRTACRAVDLADLVDEGGWSVRALTAFFCPIRIETSTCCAALLFDFLERQVDRVDEAYTQHQLRHLQLPHYRVNELGDIQTEPPVHGGLTDTGVQVTRRCNALRIVVDVAHGRYDLVKRAADTSASQPRG